MRSLPWHWAAAGLGLLVLLWCVPWTGHREAEVLAMLVAPDMAIGVGVGVAALVLAGVGWGNGRPTEHWPILVSLAEAT